MAFVFKVEITVVKQANVEIVVAMYRYLRSNRQDRLISTPCAFCHLSIYAYGQLSTNSVHRP